MGAGSAAPMSVAPTALALSASGSSIGSMPPRGGTAGSPVAPTGQQQSQSTFYCKSCLLHLPLVEMHPSKPGKCIRDVQSYKSISERWVRNRPLKGWWDSQNEMEQANWYRKQHGLKRGEKRKFEATYSDLSNRRAWTNYDNIDRWVPFHIYLQIELPKGLKNEAEIRAEFNDIVARCQSDCRWERNEWCIPIWQGMELRRGTGLEQVSSTSRVAVEVESSEDLRAMQAVGARLLTDFTSSFERVQGASDPSSAPMPDVSVSEQPRLREERDVMTAVVNREASFSWLSPLRSFIPVGAGVGDLIPAPYGRGCPG